MPKTSVYLLLVGWCCLSATRVVAEEDNAKPTANTIRDIEGWTVHIDDRLLAGADKELGERALRILSNRLYDIKLVVAVDKVTRLQKVPIWLDRTHGKLRPAQYHPSAGWLKANGYSESLARCVHIPNAADFVSLHHQQVQPWSVLHELAHAYHDQVLGFEDAAIKAAWVRFRDNGKYDKTLHISGKQVRHYGLTNQMEFFAEMTEAYFGHNDFFPFNRAELKSPGTGTLRAARQGLGTVALILTQGGSRFPVGWVEGYSRDPPPVSEARGGSRVLTRPTLQELTAFRH